MYKYNNAYLIHHISIILYKSVLISYSCYDSLDFEWFIIDFKILLESPHLSNQFVVVCHLVAMILFFYFIVILIKHLISALVFNLTYQVAMFNVSIELFIDMLLGDDIHIHTLFSFRGVFTIFMTHIKRDFPINEHYAFVLHPLRWWGVGVSDTWDAYYTVFGVSPLCTS